MDSLIEKLKNGDGFEDFVLKYCEEHNIDYENLDEEESPEIFREIILAYVPELANIPNDQLISLILENNIDPTIVYVARDMELSKEDAIALIKKDRYFWMEIIKKYPEYFDRDLVAKLATYSHHLDYFRPFVADYPEIFEGILKSYQDSSYELNLNSILSLPLTKEQIIRVLLEKSLYYIELDEKLLQDEDIVVALLTSDSLLPKNFDMVPADILVNHLDDLLSKFDKMYNSELGARIINKDERLVEAYIKSRYFDSSVFRYIDKKYLPILEANIDSIYEKLGSYNIINEVTKYSLAFLKKLWKNVGLNGFDPNLVADNIEMLLEDGLDLKYIRYDSNNILSEPAIIRKIIDYESRTTGKITIIEKANGKALSENVLYAIEKGYELSDRSPKAMFSNEGVVRYVVDNKRFDLLSYLSLEMVNKYEDEITSTLVYYDGMFLGNLVHNPKIVLTIIKQTGKYDILSGIFFGENDIVENWYPFVHQLYEMGFRITEDNRNNFIVWNPALMLEYIKITRNPNDIMFTTYYSEELLNYVADLGFILDQRCYGEITCNDKIVRNTIMHGDIESINYIGRALTDEEIEIIYQRGYRLSNKSSYSIRQSEAVFRKELELSKDPIIINYTAVNLSNDILSIALDLGYYIDSRTPTVLLSNEYLFTELCQRGHAECLQYALFVPSNNLIEEYFKQGNIMDDKTSQYLRQSPYAIHLMLEKTKDPFTLDLAIDDIYEDDFRVALDLGYIVTDKTPIQIRNNESLMNLYLAKELAKYPNNTDRINSLAKRIGAVAVCSAFEDLIKYQEFIDSYDNVEIEKIIKFVYLVDTKDKFLTIVHNGNANLLKQVYDLCSKLNSSREFDVIMFKSIVNNFSDYAVLCANFVNSEYTREDIRLLYKVLVDGVQAITFKEPDNNKLLGDVKNVSTLEELRHYKESTHFETNKEIGVILLKVQGQSTDPYNPPDRELKNIIFKLLCNKSYLEITVLLNQFLNTTRIDELLNCIKNPAIRAELENYKVFIALIEDIYNMDNIDSLARLAYELNDKVYAGSKDIDLIWASFKNIVEEAKSFFGEEIRESIIHFDTIDTTKGSSIVTGDEKRDEDAPVIVTKGKYGSDGFEYAGRTYSGTVDLIELNGVPFVTFVHTLNAFGSGARIADFKNPRLIGRTYICLSAMSDEHIGYVNRGSADIDHVSVLFSDFSSDQLAMASERDIYSQGGDNSLNLTSHSPSNLHPVRQVIQNTFSGSGGYNEYVFYREDGQGRVIYPSAVLVSGAEPVEAEIDAAIYLGVPLVKINHLVYGKKIEPSERLEIEPDRKTRSIEEWKELRDSIQIVRGMVEPTEPTDEDTKAL